jgi:glyoxylase-like metal-dependent hydrolase (beta-lactamase superfamily II)
MHGIVRVPIVFVNAYLVDADPDDPRRGWVLIDSGLPGLGAPAITRAASARYGAQPPRAIILTHGHFDHAGSAARLATAWNVPIFAHELELPYLTGRSDYPPPDPTVGGALAMMSRTFPYGSIDLGGLIRPLHEDGSIAALPGWRVLHTPGHTAGHVSLFRESDGTLLAGDALATMNQESWITTVTMERELRWPPAPLTTDWTAANASVHRLAALRPRAIAAGHGLPMTGDRATLAMEAFASRFVPPRDGRYVRRPARADEHGVVSLPPPVADPVGGAIRGGAIAAAVTGVVLTVDRARRRSRRARRRVALR